MMAANSAINLYITTCRYVIQSNPYDPETWTELYRYLPFLRQSLGCCVCGHVLQEPMGPIEGPCQHHVCKTCIGGKMRLKPTCSWCKNFDEFVENPILRTVIQCFKKLCEFLASSAISAMLTNANNAEANVVMSAIHDGLAIRDDYTSPEGPQLGLFPPTLQKVGSRRPSGEEQNKQSERNSPRDQSGEGEGQTTGSICSTNCELSDDQESDEVLLLDERNQTEIVTSSAGVITEESNKLTPDFSRSPKRKRRQSKTPPCTITNSSNHIVTPIIITSTAEADSSQPEHSLYETVAAEHDYNKDLTNGNNLSPIPKMRIRKIEGDHESLIKRPKHIAETVLSTMAAELSQTVTNSNDALNNAKSPGSPLVSSSSNTPVKECPDIVRNRLSLNKKKQVNGCRCGMATPNPGKLTCCGQRCPCYSAFKGCVDCRCRGCRNPRGDTPGPNSLKAQLQHHFVAPPLVPLAGPKPQIILTPIKVDSNESDIDIDV